MEIKVTRSVPYDKGYETRCMYNDGDFWGHSVCAHHVYRDRTHGRQAPVERRLPKCALFGVWLDGQYNKCDACLEACKEALGKPMQKPMTYDETLVAEDPVWVESKIPGVMDDWFYAYGGDDEEIELLSFGDEENWLKVKAMYNRTWRCWASRPTDEEREAAAWES